MSAGKIKCVMVGNARVGKSALMKAYCDELYRRPGGKAVVLGIQTTVGVDYKEKIVNREGRRFKIQIWDTAGQERYRSLAPMYYRGAAAAIVVYDITNKDSFNGAKSWVKELQRRGDPNVVIALAGNKMDLEHKRKVEFEEASAYAQENNILHMETSAKSATNVKALFVEIARKLPKNPPETQREAFPIIPPKGER